MIASTVDLRSQTDHDNRAGMERLLAAARRAAGAGARRRRRALRRAPPRRAASCCARERIELLLDRDAPFLELSPLAAWGTDYHVGASIVTGIGVVSGVECVIIAHDPTVRGGAMNPYTLKKTLRALEIARREPAAGDQPRRVGRRRPAHAGRPVRPGRPDLPRPHRAVGAGHPHASRSCSATRPPAARTCPACATTR